jgi:hypothetical protein
LARDIVWWPRCRSGSSVTMYVDAAERATTLVETL